MLSESEANIKLFILKTSPIIMKLYSISMLRPLKDVQFCSNPRQAKILTTDIHGVFRGLKFEPNAGIGQNGMFFKGLILLAPPAVPVYILIVLLHPDNRDGPKDRIGPPVL
jgi:hypothetical protein